MIDVIGALHREQYTRLMKIGAIRVSNTALWAATNHYSCAGHFRDLVPRILNKKRLPVRCALACTMIYDPSERHDYACC